MLHVHNILSTMSNRLGDFFFGVSPVAFFKGFTKLDNNDGLAWDQCHVALSKDLEIWEE